MKRLPLIISIPAGAMILSLSFLTVCFYKTCQKKNYATAKKFLGDYKLKVLDHKPCENCIVRLYDGYTYDIIYRYDANADAQVVGHGKWSLGSAIDIPGSFLVIDDGPRCVIWEDEREIPYIDRD